MFLVKNDTLVSDPYLIWIETDRVIFDTNDILPYLWLYRYIF